MGIDSLVVSAETTQVDVVEVAPEPELRPDTSELERAILGQGLVDAQSKDTTLVLDMKYSTEDNFLNKDVYGDFDACYLQGEVVEMLAHASAYVQKRDPDLRLMIFDCVRPRSVQFQMWEIVKGTDQQKYVAAPTGGGSMHNYGCAVDLGLVHVDSGLVDMGTPFDFFGKLAQPRYEVEFVKTGELTQAQLDNRRRLRAAMLDAGFHGILSEWWHFNAFKKDYVRSTYQIVE
ncbi:M15 family metallopeptidase [Pontibacter sp. G13]|uniref:M15 family metallopeptidase n=1 Tax=Pontibacter sp. G13 TaxID=3074898 RepID=UPI00288A35B3|nr:M15 family metallopeptidase [Pontibacter sp. G13]WNJ18874.1 M15 family metallopeptidase [Pontibacter sp. G13]